MPVSREQFDADLQASSEATAALVAADTDYIAAVDAFIALPQVIDLTNEDDQVKSALQTVTDAKTKVDEAKSRIPTQP
jgi:predicted aconitase with swiveling domain